MTHLMTETPNKARRAFFAAVLLAAAMVTLPLGASPVFAGIAEDFQDRISPADAQTFANWRAARRAHDAAVDAFWTEVEDKRAARRQKKAARAELTPADYVMSFPPKYEGPQLPPPLLRAWTRFVEEEEAKLPRPPEPPQKEIPGIEDFLAAAKGVYGFVPERVSERSFKERYAEEAVALGLSKTQVVRVYALETGGQGTADMQSGVNPISKRGKPISTALGYAQLLDANSVNELAKHGPRFIARMQQLAARSDTPRERAIQIRNKIAVLQRMITAAKSVPNSWASHQTFAKTPQGQGIHAINIDGDIGPLLQAVKLLGLKEEAAKAGKFSLLGNEMELMNLSGPGTGLEILLNRAAANAPTVNFFTRKAYNVNKMAQNLTGAGLLAELDRRMDTDISKPGAAEFAAAFDSIASTPLPWR